MSFHFGVEIAENSEMGLIVT